LAAHRLGVQIASASKFFEKASAEAHDLATVSGELYFERHRGTYTSQSRTKRWNRIAQHTLREAEMWSVASGGTYTARDFEPLWKALALNQFHDILPGSSIDWVYEEAERDLRQVTERARDIGEAAMAVIAGSGGSHAFFNTTSHPRSEVGELGGKTVRVEAPPCGWAVRVTDIHNEGVEVSDRTMENELLRVQWDERGLLTSIFDKEVGREVLGGLGNVLELHDDNPRRHDAWDLDLEHRAAFVEITAIEQVR